MHPVVLSLARRHHRIPAPAHRPRIAIVCLLPDLPAILRMLTRAPQPLVDVWLFPKCIPLKPLLEQLPSIHRVHFSPSPLQTFGPYDDIIHAADILQRRSVPSPPGRGPG